MLSGNGTFKWSDGRVYRGEWRANKFNGVSFNALKFSNFESNFENIEIVVNCDRWASLLGKMERGTKEVTEMVRSMGMGK